MNYVKFIQFRNYKFTSKVVNKTNEILYKVQNFETPEKLKGTFLERWGKFTTIIALDQVFSFNIVCCFCLQECIGRIFSQITRK